MSSPNVRKVLQDKYGFMWFATQDGLNRFDGSQFTKFNSNTVNKRLSILGIDVFDIDFDQTGNYLWALSAYNGLSRIDIRNCSVVQMLPLSKPEGSQWFKSFEIKGNAIYVGSNAGILTKVNAVSGKVELSLNINKLVKGADRLDDLYVDSRDKIWLFLPGKGIAILNKDLTQTIKFIPESLLAGVGSNKVLEYFDLSVQDDRIFLATTGGLKIVSLENFQLLALSINSLQLPEGVIDQEVNSIHINAGMLIVAGKGGMFEVDLKSGKSSRYIASRDFEDNEWITSSNSIFQTGNTIWVGTQYGIGCFRNKHLPFTGYHSSMNGSDVKIVHSLTLMPESDSVIIVCADNGLFRVNHLNGNMYRISDRPYFFTAFKGPANRIMASATSGMIVYDGKSTAIAEDVFPELKSLKEDLFISAASLQDSLYFLASQYQKGLFIWDAQRRTLDSLSTRTRGISLKSNVINRVYIDSANRVWILCDDVVSIYNPFNRTIQHLDLKGLDGNPLSIIMDIWEGNKKYWLAVYGTGIVELTHDNKVKGIISSKEGLNSLGVYKIYGINDSLLGVSSNNGLSLFNIHTNKVSNYYESDGLQSSSFEETSGCMYNGSVFWGGANGFTKFDPAKLFHNPDPPGVYFSSTRIKTPGGNIESQDIFVKQLEVPNDATQITVGFSALNYSYPEKASFKYKIPQIEEEWVSKGNEAFLDLIGLHPGTYTLQLKAANEDGVWSEPIELTLIFLPKWYQTWWFKALVALVLMGGLYSLYRYRLAQIRKEQQIRQRIASDLHDDIGSTLNSVKVFANLAMMKPENNTTYLQQLKEGVQSAIVGVRDMVWVLDDNQDSLDHLAARIDQFIYPVVSAQEIHFEKLVDPALANIILKKEEKRNLFLILKEALNNSIKYANATVLQLHIEPSSHAPFAIIVRDNGKGFDMATITKGNGLNNLHYRAQQIKYSIEINSAPGKGTSITLTKA